MISISFIWFILMSIMLLLNKINEEIARRITLFVGTMWCTYAFCLLVLLPTVIPSSQMLIMYISSSFLQLVFLPLIMVGQRVLSKESEARGVQDHQAIMQELIELREIRRLLEQHVFNKQNYGP